ncbi:MAG: phosphatidate cytidylyltransferase [Oscillospiraceae bacterium]
MKKRVISSVVMIAILGTIIWLFDGVYLNIMLSIIGFIASFELLRAFNMMQNKLFLLVYGLYAVLTLMFEKFNMLTVFLLLFLTFCIMMFSNDRHYEFKEGAAVFFACNMTTLGLLAMLRLRAFSPFLNDGRFLFLAALGMGWLCDTFAFFAGSAFGKRKLCPKISPKKTVEGAIGGLLGTPLVITAVYALFLHLSQGNTVFAGQDGFWQYVYIFAVSMIGAGVGMIGDLSASYIKRECGLKDFGDLIPGHGGAMDRIDSVLFTGVFALSAFSGFFLIFR